MKKYFFLFLIFYHLVSTASAQKKLYLPDSSFKFKLAQFSMPLYNKGEIVGMFKDYFLVRTSINNSFTLLLVDKQGVIIQNFEGDWQLPENWQTEDGLWLFQVSESQPRLEISTISVLKYRFTTKGIELKAFEIKDYFQYSSIKPVISDDAFLCSNSRRDIIIFRFDNNDLKIIRADNRNILRFMYDGKRGLINVFEIILNASARNGIKFYQFQISEEADFIKHLKWLKNISDLEMLEFDYYSQIRFISSEEFIIHSGKFEDNQTIAAKYDFEGRINSRFNLSNVAGFQRDAFKISFINNNWFLTHPYLSGLIYQATSSTSKEIILPGHTIVELPESFESDKFVFADTTYVISTIDTRNLQLNKHEYKIPIVEKSYDLKKVSALGDGSYWVFYNSPNGTYVKYNHKDEEVYRTPDSLRLLNNKGSFYQLNDTDVLIATHDLESEGQCYKCLLALNRYLKINGKNESSILETKNLLQGKPIYYYDSIHQHFYVKTDSLIRYNSDFKIDTTFQIEKNIKIGSMLVSKQGNIYLGQTFYNNNIDSLYKLDSKGKVVWRKKYILSKSNPYSITPGGGFYGGLYPVFNKDSIIIWGVLTCAEGCYTSHNIALDENNNEIKLTYLEKPENNNPAYSLIDKYGVFMKNSTTFMLYNKSKNTIEKDTNTLIKFTISPERISELDALPDQDMLVIEQNKIKKYSFRKTIWADIINLEKEKKNNSHSFWGLSVADALNRQIKLDVFTSDSSQAVLKVIPENSDAAYIKDQTLFFTGKEGKFAVFAQSVKGGEPYISSEFTIRKGTPPFTITIVEGGLYINRPTAIKFESVEDIFFKIDSLQGSCVLQDNKIAATLPFSWNCRMYYSWTSSDIYSSGSSVTYIGLSADLLLSDEELVQNTSIFPNPLTHNILTIKSRRPIGDINFIDMLGQKKHFSGNANDYRQNYYFSDIAIPKGFSSGIYIIEIADTNGEIIKREKLIILR